VIGLNLLRLFLVGYGIACLRIPASKQRSELGLC
jgi:hypothetical protein